MFQNQRQYSRCPIDTPLSEAVLVLGRQKIQAELLEISIGSFAILVPRPLPFMTHPLARLQIGELDYIVRLTRQEPRHGGFLIALEQVEEILPNETWIPASPIARWMTRAAWVAAIVIVAAALDHLSGANVSTMVADVVGLRS